MDFTVRIQPRSAFGAIREERLADVQDLANKVALLDGVEKTECLETFQKSGAFENPNVVIALISGSAAILTALINNLFQLLHEERKKGKYEAFSVEIQHTHFQVAEDTEADIQARIQKMIEGASKKKQDQ